MRKSEMVSTMFPELKIRPSRTMKEFEHRNAKCWDFKPLKDGERVMFVTPAFDFRNGPDNRYGQHGCGLHFAKRKGNKIVSFEVFTGWSVTGEHTMMDGQSIDFMSPGLYSHYRFKKDASDSAYKAEDCPYTGKHCYGELGSGLYADVVLERLVNEGSYGVWDEIEKELDSNG